MEKDIYRRDLRVNAIAVNIKTDEIFDPTDGLKDFENKVLNGIREENFTDDPLRLLRIFRFWSQKYPQPPSLVTGGILTIS